MYKYRCLECDSLFDEPAVYYEKHGFDSPPYEAFDCCPFCRGQYEDNNVCSICGKQVFDSYARLSDGEICCDDCFLDIHEYRKDEEYEY